ncbi:MAG: hypothetical protein Q7U56_10425 [Humidesulfovibrio sp.]|nr:hypothetical protein [Humidesulfovibrio sp.]
MSDDKIREFSPHMCPTEQFIYKCPLLLNNHVVERLEKAGILPLTSFPRFYRATRQFPVSTSERLCLQFAMSLDWNPKHTVNIGFIRGTIGDRGTLELMAKWIMNGSKW